MPMTAHRVLVTCALLGVGALQATPAQTMPTVVLRDPAMARGALKETNTALKRALQSGRKEDLAQAITTSNTVFSALGDLGYTGVEKDAAVTRGLYHDAIAALVRVLTVGCEKGQLPDGLTGADLLRTLSPATVKGIGAARMTALRARLSACLRLTLRIDSRITASELNYAVHVEVVVPLEYDLNAGSYHGDGQITILSQTAAPPGPCVPRFNNRPAPFRVNRLDVTKADDSHLGDVVLADYQVGQVDDSAVLVCPAPAPAIPMRQMNWTTLFQIARSSKGDGSSAPWRLGYPQNVVASRQVSGPFATYMNEATDMVLMHTGKTR